VKKSGFCEKISKAQALHIPGHCFKDQPEQVFSLKLWTSENQMLKNTPHKPLSFI